MSLGKKGILDLHESCKHTMRGLVVGEAGFDPWGEWKEPSVTNPSSENQIGLGHLPRSFEGPDPTEFKQTDFSFLLKYAFGVSAWRWINSNRLPFRVFPTAGNLQSVEVYIVAEEFGEEYIYRYNPFSHSLERKCRQRSLGQLRSPRILLTSRYGRTLRKYGLRAHRLCPINTGHAVAALFLVAEQMGLKPSLVELKNSGFSGLDLHSDEEMDVEIELAWDSKNEGLPNHHSCHSRSNPFGFHDRTDFVDTVMARRSAMDFDPDYVLPKKDFLSLLSRTTGSFWTSFMGEELPFTTTGVFIHRVEGISAGFYRINRLGELKPVELGDFREFCQVLHLDAELGGTASALFVLMGDVPKAVRKNGPDGYYRTLMSCGALGHALSIEAQRLAIGANSIGGFYDDLLKKRFCHKHGGEPLYSLGVGEGVQSKGNK